MGKILRIVFLFFLYLTSSCVEETSQPLFPCSNYLTDPYGVCSHITWKGDKYDYEYMNRLLNVANELNVNYIRTDFNCSGIKPYNGIANISIYDSVVNEAMSKGINIVGILSRPSYDVQIWENPIAYKNYLEYTFERYNGKVVCWEVVNEVDRLYSHYTDAGQKYLQDLAMTKSVAKRVSPSLKLLYTGISWAKTKFLPETMALGAYDYIDYMNMHYYGEPEDMPSYLETVRKSMDDYNWEKSVWITETGCSTVSYYDKYDPKMMETELGQAQRLPRTYLLAFAYGVDKVFWYCLRSCELDNKNTEDFYGLTHNDLSPKPSFKAYKTLTTLCPSGSSRPSVTIRNGIYEASWQTAEGKQIVALWTPKGSQKVDISVYNAKRVYNIFGDKIKKTKRIDISESITYIISK